MQVIVSTTVLFHQIFQIRKCTISKMMTFLLYFLGENKRKNFNGHLKCFEATVICDKFCWKIVRTIQKIKLTQANLQRWKQQIAKS